MLNLRPEDTIHKSYLNRLLIEIIDNPLLSSNLAFKGGTCAEMLGFLDRFSVDLDFDVVTVADELNLRNEFHKIFRHSGLTLTRESDSALFFQLRYASEPGKRSIIRASASSIKIKANEYKVQYLPEIDRLVNCQTIETMFANKLVAITDRYDLHKTIGS
ncbi:MAG: nucleotidyl transferase AbiEii/AbiGii toxin family protein, partial [Patescibacteria group bacterium]